MKYLSKSLYKIICIVLLSATSVNVFANQKVDELLRILNYGEAIKETLDHLSPPQNDSTSESAPRTISELNDSHSQEELELFSSYFNWESVYSEIKKSFISTYTTEEIDSLYNFTKTKDGASYFRKQDTFGEQFQTYFSSNLERYSENLIELQKSQKEEREVVLAKLASEIKSDDQREHESEKLSISDFVRFSVNRENGEMLGYRVRAGKLERLFLKSPFKEGDLVVSVDGNELDNPSAIRDMYFVIKTMRQVHFEVKRDDGVTGFMIDLFEYENI